MNPQRLSDLDHEYAEVHVHITDEEDQLIALGCGGGQFPRHAAGKLLRELGLWSEVRYWMLVSALSRQDAKCAKMYLIDWNTQDKDHRPSAVVSKFIPGEHYHVLGTKFNSLLEAKAHLNRKGYKFGGVEEKFLYTHEGD